MLGGIFWLISLPTLWNLAWFILLNLYQTVACATPRCALPSPSEPGGWLLAGGIAGLALLGFRQLAISRPRLGYPILGAIGGGILVAVLSLVILSRNLGALLLLAAWPGWSGIAFVGAAWRSRSARHAIPAVRV